MSDAPRLLGNLFDGTRKRWQWRRSSSECRTCKCSTGCLRDGPNWRGRLDGERQH